MKKVGGHSKIGSQPIMIEFEKKWTMCLTPLNIHLESLSGIKRQSMNFYGLIWPDKRENPELYEILNKKTIVDERIIVDEKEKEGKISITWTGIITEGEWAETGVLHLFACGSS